MQKTKPCTFAEFYCSLSFDCLQWYRGPGRERERERESKRNTCETNSHDPWHPLFFVSVKCLFSLNSKTSSIFKDTALLLLLSDAIKKKSWFYCMPLSLRERDSSCGSMMIGRKKINKSINSAADIYQVQNCKNLSIHHAK